MSLLSTIAFASSIAVLCSASLGFAAETARPATRMETTARAESAPLNLVARAFRDLEPRFTDSVRSQRLTYRIHRAPSGTEAIEVSLKRLMINIAGGDDFVQVREITSAHDDGSARALLTKFENTVTDAIAERGHSSEPGALALEKLRAAANALGARTDVKVFSAEIREDDLPSRVLLLLDEETDELLLLYLGRRAHEG